MTDQHGMTPSLRLAHVDGMLDYGREHGTIPLATFESARNHLAAVVNEHNALLAEVEQPQGERDGDVRAVAEAVSILEGMLDDDAWAYDAGRARNVLLDCFARELVALEARDAKAPIKRTPEQWCEQYGVDIADPDGWRHTDAPAWDEPITLADFYERARESTVRLVGSVDWKRIAWDAEGGDQ